MQRSLGAVRALGTAIPRTELGKTTSVQHTKEWDAALPYTSIPGPKPVPVVGNLWRFLPKIGTFDGMDQISQHRYFNETYGDIVRLSGMVVRKDLILLFSPKDVEKFFRNEGPWPRRESLLSYVHYKQTVRSDVFQGNIGVLVGQGELWHQARTVVNPSMMQPRSARLYVDSMNNVAQDMIARVRTLQRQDAKNLMPKDFLYELNKWALESICVVALNKRLGLLDPNSKNPEAMRFIQDVLTMFDLMNDLEIKLSPWRYVSTPAWRKFVRTMDRITQFELKHLNETIDKLEKKGEDNDKSEFTEEPGILEKLLMKDKQIAFNMSYDMLVAGIDTTTRVVAAALYFLSSNPDKQEKLRQELKTLLPHPDSPITRENLEKMTYLRAAIKETTRLAPIAIGNFRQSPTDLVLGGYKIPEGTDVLCGNMWLCRKEENFPEPNKYVPERWLRGATNKYINPNLNPFVFLPFGFGPRSCIGKRLANLEIECIVAKMVRNFLLEWPHPEMTWTMHMLYGVGSPLQFKVTSVDK